MTLLHVCLTATNTPVTSSEFYVCSHWETNDVLHGKGTKGNINLGNDLQKSLCSRQRHLKVMKLTANMEHEQSFGWCQQDSAHPTLLLAVTCSKWCHVCRDTENTGIIHLVLRWQILIKLSSRPQWTIWEGRQPPTIADGRRGYGSHLEQGWPTRGSGATCGSFLPLLWPTEVLKQCELIMTIYFKFYVVIFSMRHYFGDQGDLVTLK